MRQPEKAEQLIYLQREELIVGHSDPYHEFHMAFATRSLSEPNQ